MIRILIIVFLLFPFTVDAARSRRQSNRRNTTRVAPLKPKVLLDPGHGGDDFGTKVGSCIEKNVNLKTAEYVAALLRKKGYDVQFTRKKDVFVSLQDRVEIANQSKCKIMVSIHFNAAQSKEAEGLEIFYFKDPMIERKDCSKNLADAVMRGSLQTTNAKSRGVKTGNFCVIRDTLVPSILVEGGFLTNERELAKIRQDAYLRSLAQGIVDGIESYFEKK